MGREQIIIGVLLVLASVYVSFDGYRIWKRTGDKNVLVRTVFAALVGVLMIVTLVFVS